jgi:hypothetical protein
MDEALVVRVLERRSDLGHQVHDLGAREPPPPAQQHPGVGSAHELHDHEVPSGVEHGDDVRMREARAQLGLPAKAADERPVAGEALAYDLDRDVAVGSLVAGAVDRGHPARAHPPEQAVATAHEGGQVFLCRTAIAVWQRKT